MEFVGIYFNSEKAESLLFIVVGVFSVLLSLIFLTRIKRSFYTGLAFPILFVGLIQLVVGTVVFLRSEEDKERVLNYMALEPERIHSEEIPRMVIVTKTFAYYRYVELALLLTGIFLLILVRTSGLVKGIGLGLIIQVTVMLTADYFAEQRSREYLKDLREQTPILYKQS